MSENQKETDSFFLEKEKPPVAPPPRRDVKRSILLFLIGAGYGLLILLILHLGISGDGSLALISIYLYGILGGYGIILLKKSYTDADRSRDILTDVLEKSIEAHILVDPQGKTLHANPRFKSLVGKKRLPPLSSFAEAFDNGEDLESILQLLEKRTANENSATAEVCATKGLHNTWFQITCQNVTGRDGYRHWRFDDITRRHQMENTIREEREKLRDFTDNAPVGFFSVNKDGRFIFANDTLLKLIGTDSQTLIQHGRLHDYLDNPPLDGQPYDCFPNGGNHQHGEIMLKGSGGRIFHAAITHSVAQNRHHEIITRSVVYDLTSEHKMKEALRASEDRFHRLFEEAPVGICMLSEDGVISHANRTLAMMLHKPQRELNGKPLTTLIADDMRLQVKSWLRALRDNKKPTRHIDVTLTGTREIYAQIYARKLQIENSFVLHFIDLTEQRNLERQFTQSQKMQAVGQLAGGIAHDFNNLLTAMIGFCDLLLLRHKPGDPSFADIMQIKQNANRAANLVRQLLAFSRQQTLQPRILYLTDVLAELAHLLRRLIGANIELNLSHGSDIGLIRADQGQMEQVFINLVVNARDSMHGGGKLTIRTRNVINDKPVPLNSDDQLPPGEWVATDVTDTGTGIPEDVLPRIFEPFFSTKEVGAGTGLGLATVHGIIHQTGGFIDVQSKGGQGTTFTIYLPLAEETEEDRAAEEDQEEKQSTADLTGSSSILLVEDEDAVRTFSARALSNKGYHVADAASGEAALDLLKDGSITPEILITDVMMPEMDGTALAKIVREKYPHIKIIFISGYAEDRFKEHLGEDVWFLPKPFTLKQLATKVKEVLEE